MGVLSWLIDEGTADGTDLAGQTAKSFLGLQLQCARCHDHKYEQWKQDEFNGFAAWFNTLKQDRRQPAMMEAKDVMK